MKQSILLIGAALALSITACGAGTPGAVIPSDSLELTYVSGHLGIYADCPEDAYDAKVGKGDFAGESAGMMACPPDDENCIAGFMNCEAAEVTIRIKNIGSETLNGINVVELQLLSTQESILHSMPIKMVYVPAELEDGLAPGEEVVVRVEFQGPVSNWEMISHPVHILVIDSKNQGAEITTPPLDSLPMMVS